MSWYELKDKCPWRMVALEEGWAERCAALRGTGLACCESFCAPWYWLNDVKDKKPIKEG